MMAKAHDLEVAVHDLAVDLDGNFSAEHGIGKLKRGELARYKSDVEFDLMRKIKAALDPKRHHEPRKGPLMSDLTQTDEIALAKLEPILLRAKVETPVVTSFGTIPERAVLLVRAEDPRRRGRLGRGIRKFPDAWGGKPRAPNP